MITRIEIDGFKSFRNFSMDFTPFTVIAGINASGKSNLFDALKLLSKLASGDLKDAFTDERGTVQEQFMLLGDHQYETKMTFAVELLVNRKIKDKWDSKAEINSPRLRYELSLSIGKDQHGFDTLFVDSEYLSKINTEKDTWAKKFLGNNYKYIWKTTRSGGSPDPFIRTVETNGLSTIYIRQDARQGKNAAAAKSSIAEKISQTVLSGINNTDFPHAFAAAEEMRKWRFMQLNPEKLRKPTIQDARMNYVISSDGANLAAALFRIKLSDQLALTGISRLLNKFLPEYISVDVFDDKENKQFIIVLTNIDGKKFTSRVLSEGTLRILTLCVMRYDDEYAGLLCFEEPENGIHPQRINDMIGLLEGLAVDYEDEEATLRQVIVNTHSPKLIGCLCNAERKPDLRISVWLSKMIPMTHKNTENTKSILRITNITPVDDPLNLFSEQENKMTALALKQYLENN